MTTTSPGVARRAWQHFEPVHAIVYFAPEARARYDAVGLRGGWMGYFASRSAPMGAVGPDVVGAVFHNFAPPMVRRAIPDAWAFASLDAILAARLDAVDGALTRLWGDTTGSAGVAEAARLAEQASAHLRPDGRPLFAGHMGLPVPAAPHLALWHACTLLREHRFDGHVAALTAHGVTGIEALLLQVGAGTGVDAATLRAFRGWSEEEWTGCEDKLRGRGLLNAEGAVTDEGRSLRSRVEEMTDALAEEPWTHLGDDQTQRLFTLLAPLVNLLDAPGGLIYPNPIGVARPALG